ncbi:MAG TPA: hypothetical protein VM943_09625 [Pyrinomonadaceae bacterium]|nr:hypothetical protein [Pyrinomonadaceae bacterium]
MIGGGNGLLFQSFFMGGFECSTHRRCDGKRLDLIAATGHDELVVADYLRLQQQGIGTARDGLRWHLIEHTPGEYDFASVLPMVRAARETGTQVVWDLCHFGWPDWLDIFRPEFVARFAQFARAFVSLLTSEGDQTPLITPINEISFFAWAGGRVGYFNPCARRRGRTLKAQLLRATVEGIEAMWAANPRTRIVQVEPLINIVAADPRNARMRRVAENYRLAHYESWDVLSGRLWPELGGAMKYLDIIGVNYYSTNQWIHGSGAKIFRGHPQYRPLRHMLKEVYERYERPLFVAETGIEDEERPEWLRYVGREVRAAMQAGVPVEGICLYPIVNHPGWTDERHCHNGLWDYADEQGGREIYQPLAEELQRQKARFRRLRGNA